MASESVVQRAQNPSSKGFDYVDKMMFERYVRHYEELMLAWGIYRPYEVIRTSKGECKPIPGSMGSWKLNAAKDAVTAGMDFGAEAKADGTLGTGTATNNGDIITDFALARLKQLPFIPDNSPSFKAAWERYEAVMKPFTKDEGSIQTAHQDIIAFVDYSCSSTRVEGQPHEIHQVIIDLGLMFKAGHALPLSGYKSAYVYNYNMPLSDRDARSRGQWFEFKPTNQGAGTSVMNGFQRPSANPSNMGNSMQQRMDKFFKRADDTTGVTGLTYGELYDRKAVTNGYPFSNVDAGVVWLENNDVERFSNWANYELSQTHGYIINSQGSMDQTKVPDYFNFLVHPHLVHLTSCLAYYIFHRYGDAVAMGLINNSLQNPEKIDEPVGKVGRGFSKLGISMCGKINALYASKYAMRLVKRHCLIPANAKLISGNYEADLSERYVMVRDVECSHSVERYVPVKLGELPMAIPPTLRYHKLPTLLNHEAFNRDSIQLLNACLMIVDSDTSCFSELRDRIFQTIGSNDASIGFLVPNLSNEMGKDWDQDTGDALRKEGVPFVMSNQLVGDGMAQAFRVNKLVSYFLVRYVESMLHLALFMFPGITGMRKVLEDFDEQLKQTQKEVIELMVKVNNGETAIDIKGQQKLPIRSEIPGWEPECEMRLSELMRNLRPLIQMEGGDYDVNGFHVVLDPKKHDELVEMVYLSRAGQFMYDTMKVENHQAKNILRNAAVIMHVVNMMTMFQNSAIAQNPKSFKEFKDANNNSVQNIAAFTTLYEQDTNKQYTWKSLKDSIYAVFLFYTFNRYCGHQELDIDQGEEATSAAVDGVIKELGLGSAWNNPSLAALKNVGFIEQVMKLFGARN